MKVKIEKNIYVRDKYKVKRQAFTAGQEVELASYHQVLATNAVVNPEDLPAVGEAPTVKRSMHSSPIETKVLDFKSSVEIVKSEEPVVESTAKEEKPKKVKKTEEKVEDKAEEVKKDED
jgi:hypothetical protein